MKNISSCTQYKPGDTITYIQISGGEGNGQECPCGFGTIGDYAAICTTCKGLVSHMPDSCIESCTHYQAGDTITYYITTSDTGACDCGFGTNCECVAVCPTCGGMVSKITAFCDNNTCEYYPYLPTDYEGWRWN